MQGMAASPSSLQALKRREPAITFQCLFGWLPRTTMGCKSPFALMDALRSSTFSMRVRGLSSFSSILATLMMRKFSLDFSFFISIPFSLWLFSILSIRASTSSISRLPGNGIPCRLQNTLHALMLRPCGHTPQRMIFTSMLVHVLNVLSYFFMRAGPSL